MKNSRNLLSGAAMAVCLLLGSNAMAQAMSSTDFSAGKTRIKAEYGTDKTACDSQAGNAKDICVAQAKGKENIALAELDNSYKPTLKTQYKLSVAKGEAAYDTAKQKCDDLSGNTKLRSPSPKTARSNGSGHSIIRKQTRQPRTTSFSTACRTVSCLFSARTPGAGRRTTR